MKDPALLFFYDKWISSTGGMKAEFRAWYMDLLIYQYDKGGVPQDVDEIAGICRVRPSEYDMFKQMLDQVFKHKFTICSDGLYRNEVTSEVLRRREEFKDKRSKSGNIGVIIKTAMNIKGFNDKYLKKLKDELYEMELSEIEKHKDKQVLEQMLKLYINANNTSSSSSIDLSFIDNKEYISIIEKWLKYKSEKGQSYKPTGLEQMVKKLFKFSSNDSIIALQIIEDAMSNNYDGFFEPKKSNITPKPTSDKLEAARLRGSGDGYDSLNTD